MTVFGVSISCRYGHDGVEIFQGGGVITLDRCGIDAICSKLTGEVHVQSGLGLLVLFFSWVEE